MKATPSDVFYIVGEKDLNGFIDLASEGKETYSLNEAVDVANGYAMDHHGTPWIIECRCVKQIKRGKTWDPKKRLEGYDEQG